MKDRVAKLLFYSLMKVGVGDLQDEKAITNTATKILEQFRKSQYIGEFRVNVKKETLYISYAPGASIGQFSKFGFPLWTLTKNYAAVFDIMGS